MPSIPLHPTPSTPHETPEQNPLPQLLQTPSGLALLEIQGTINMPAPSAPLEEEGTGDNMEIDHSISHETPVGRLVFPDIMNENDKKNNSKSQRVYLYVGKHQRLTGTLKKLPKPLGVIRRRNPNERETDAGDGEWVGKELEIVDIVEWKILFSNRPEPVSED